MAKKLTIVKIGGNVINDPDQLISFLQDFSNLEGMKILVHGGGKKATEIADALGLSPKMKGGRRITDAPNLEVVTMVYAGLLNKNIVAGLQSFDCNALGLSGADANVIRAHKRIAKEIDYGFAGDIDQVDAKMITSLLEAGVSPVFSAITHDKKGQLLNTNADTIAAEIAGAMSRVFQVELIYCFEKSGVLRDVLNEDTLIEDIDKLTYAGLMENGSIADGMMPKLKNCFQALEQGVHKVRLGKPELIRNKEIKHTTLKL